MNRPLVTLFATPKAYYLYDTHKNEILDVSESVFNEILHQEFKHDVPSSDIGRMQLQTLKDRGYLSDGRPDEIEHAYTTFLPILLDRAVSKITLQLTQSCNFRCKYCGYTAPADEKQRSHSANRMPWETAKAAIDFLWEHSVDSQAINIGYYGGEPLLEFELIKKVTNYAEEKFRGKDLTFSLTTNATLFNDEIIQFFIEHNIQTMISLDGPKEINDKNRVFAKNGQGTFDSVIERLTYISQNYPEFAKKIHVNMVIDPSNDFDAINSLPKDIESLGLGEVQSSIIDTSCNSWNLENREHYSAKMKYHLFLAYLYHLGRLPKTAISPLALQDISATALFLDYLSPKDQLPSKYAPGGPCVPGQMRPMVDVYGNIYPCERVGECSASMRIGTIWTGFDLTKASALLNVAKITETECKNCWASRFCTQCAKFADGGHSLSPELRLERCQGVRNSVYNAMQKIILFREIPTYY